MGRRACGRLSPVAGLLCVVLAAAALPAAAEEVATVGQRVMGTVLEVTVAAEDGRRARELAAEALTEARHWDDVLTTWRPEGQLARLNAAAGGGSVAVSPELGRALERMRLLSEATGGAFDPAVGPLVRFWRRAKPDRKDRVPKPPRLVDALRLDGGRASLSEGAALDAGGIGKGMAIDAIVSRLRRRGARAAFVDFGGSSQTAFGSAMDGPRVWEIAVAGLRPGSLHGVVRLRSGSLSTSEAKAAGDPAGSIVDARSGRPVAPGRLATVFAPDATSADAWSTALVVLGRPGLAQIEAAGLEALYEDDDGVVRTGGFPLEPLP